GSHAVDSHTVVGRGIRRPGRKARNVSGPSSTFIRATRLTVAGTGHERSCIGARDRPDSRPSSSRQPEEFIPQNTNRLTLSIAVLVACEFNLTADEARLPGGEARLTGGEARLAGGETRLAGGEARLAGGEARDTLGYTPRPRPQDIPAARGGLEKCRKDILSLAPAFPSFYIAHDFRIEGSHEPNSAGGRRL